MKIKITQQPTRFKVTAHDISERFGNQSLTMPPPEGHTQISALVRAINDLADLQDVTDVAAKNPTRKANNYLTDLLRKCDVSYDDNLSTVISKVRMKYKQEEDYISEMAVGGLAFPSVSMRHKILRGARAVFLGLPLQLRYGTEQGHLDAWTLIFGEGEGSQKFIVSNDYGELDIDKIRNLLEDRSGVQEEPPRVYELPQDAPEPEPPLEVSDVSPVTLN